MSRLLPMVSDNKLTYDIYSRLLKDRIIWLVDEIDDLTSELIMAQLLYLDALAKEDDGEDEEKAVHLYINSPGGSVTSGLAIYDTMKHIKSPIYTYSTGMSASMAAVLLAAGKKGKRFAYEHSTVMIHQPIGGTGFDQVSQVLKRADHLKKVKQTLTQILADCTGKSFEQIEIDSDRDNYMSAQEALEYGLVDKII